MGRGASMAGGLCGVGQLQQAAGPADPGEDQLWVAQDIIAIIIIIIIIVIIVMILLLLSSLQWYQPATAGDGSKEETN
jgi:heme/copper-type cytochrome/quinol oxidase subunit 2